MSELMIKLMLIILLKLMLIIEVILTVSSSVPTADQNILDKT